ncbi:MAG: type III PLP-dependent enzyme [Magnetospirillum sp. WYHS-4]
MAGMTPKIERFIADRRPETPCLIVDLDVVAAKYKNLARALPGVRIYYAVKANPAQPVLETLVGLGSCFDAAGAEEIEMCLASGAKADDISYGHTVKKRRDIARAHELGVRLFAFDSEDELKKLAELAPGSKVYCRILVENAGADWPLSRKFGCSLDMARDLMLQARDLGLDPYGLSFHVGSQQTNPQQWEGAIGRAAMVFTDLREQGVELRMLNIGGGFPARYRDDRLPPLDAYSDSIMQAMRRHFGNNIPEMIMEPGRGIVAEAGVVHAEVVLISRKSNAPDEARWIYLDVGKFGGLAETMDEAIKYGFRTPHDGGREGPVVIAGPTCDGADILYEKTPYTLPLDLKTGDAVQLLATGAYTTVYAASSFNGFAAPKEYYI